MYIPKKFEVIEQDEINTFIEENGFGQLISNANGRLFSSHIPFILSDDKTLLLGHIARKNPQAKDIDGQEILVTLQGAHDYISPNWYSKPGVPTWNYQAVHVYGACKIVDDPKWLESLVDELTQKYESTMPEPWQSEYHSSMLGAIVGVEICISEVQCKYKLSQNRSPQEQEQVVEKLDSRGSKWLAKEMSRNMKSAQQKT